MTILQALNQIIYCSPSTRKTTKQTNKFPKNPISQKLYAELFWIFFFVVVIVVNMSIAFDVSYGFSASLFTFVASMLQ